MELVYLKSFTQILQEILGAVFDTILAPVLRDVFNILLNIISEYIQEIFSNFLLRIWIIFLKLVNFFEQVFNVFSGISPVKVGDASESMSLLEYFFQLNEVQTAFLVITMIAVVLAFLTTLIAVGKSVSDMTFEDKRPISAVLKLAMKATVSFMLVPFTCLFVLLMASKMTAVINTTFNYEMNQAISDVLFITVAEPAVKQEYTGKNLEADKDPKKIFAQNNKYEDADAVKKYFDITKFNYILAYVSTILLALILLCSILQFIQRIFAILLLYLASPFFVAMIPLDEGAKFREWKNMFGAHMLSAFGPILAMKIYLVLVPVVVNGGIRYSDKEMINICIHLLFIIGGAFAVYRGRLLFIQIIDPSTASSIAASGVIATLIGGKAKMLLGVAGGGQQKAPKSKGKPKSGNQYATKSQTYSGK